MMNRKSTKKALLTSVLALILCFSMLVGTTFAWFTDSVSSGVNKILAGNLDVEAYYDNNGKQTSIENVATLFDNADGKPILWEPGAVAYENITVVNEGSLALEYGLAMNFSNENTVEDHGLSQVLKVAVVKDGVDTSKTREQIVSGITEWQKLSNWYVGGDLLKQGDQVTYGIVIWWQPTAEDNNWNVSNGKVTSDGAEYLHIDLGVNVTAWQKNYEKDSFDETYDANLVVHTVADAEARMALGESVVLAGANEPNEVLDIPAAYTGTLTLNNVSVASVQAEQDANLVIEGAVTVKAIDSSAITAAGTLNISGNGTLTAVAADVKGAFGIGGMDTEEIVIKDITVDYVSGGFAGGVGSDTKYYKDAPEGGAAIGSSHNGAVITLENVTVNKAIGGSKAAGIGARYHTGVTVNIINSTIGYVEGGVSAAGIGGSRVSEGAAESGVTINITDSTITAVGGAYGAGIGSGYDTHCQENQPLCTINIDGSTINATGGKYAAGVGTGYHNAGLAGEIKDSTVNAVSGEKFYKNTYTTAMDIGFGVVDPTREAKENPSSIVYNGTTIGIPQVVEVSSASGLKDALSDAEVGDTVVLAGNVDLGTNSSLSVDKEVVINLNGNTLNADNGHGIISLKNGASILNGTIDVDSNVAAIKAFNVGSIENVTINIDPKATEKVATAIAIQNNGYVGTIKNVTITGATQGIELGKGAKVDLIEDVHVEAVSNGSKQGVALLINAGYVGKAVDCTFKGESIGVHMMLNGTYTVALELDNCVVEGGTAALYAHDEVNTPNTNNCSLTLTYDADTVFNGNFAWEFEDECKDVVTLKKA